MLADNVKQWTREWKREGMRQGMKEGMEKGLKKGRREGLTEGVQAFQEFLLSGMAERFGPLPKEVRRSIKKVEDLDELKKLAKQLLVASSLEDLGL
jgi:flagellar biosynthesis/type III secretory pathway protein FliH